MKFLWWKSKESCVSTERAREIGKGGTEKGGYVEMGLGEWITGKGRTRENRENEKTIKTKFWKHAQIEIAQDMSQKRFAKKKKKKRQPKKNKEN